MVRPNQEAIDTFMSITGASEVVAVQKLEERGGDLNEAVNAYFNDGDRNIIRETSTAAPEDDFMDIDDPSQVELRRPPFSLLSSAPRMNPFSLLDPNFRRSLLDSGPEFSEPTPFVSHPREVREIPIEVKDGNEQSNQSGLAPTIEDVTGTAHSHDPEIHGTVIIDDDANDDEDIPSGPTANAPRQIEHNRPSAPGIDDLLEYNNDIEEEMIQAAIEASKRDAEKVYPDQQVGASNDLSDPGPQQRQSLPDDTDLAHAVSLSLTTAEREKSLREQGEKVGSSESEANKSAGVVELGKLASSSGRSELGSSSMQNEAGDVEEQPLVRRRSRRNSSGSVESIKEVEEVEVSPPSSPGQQDNVTRPLRSGNDFPSDEWGGISSEEHDEAVMLEAALFGGIPEGSAYPPFAYAPHQLMQNGYDRTMGSYPQRMPRPPSPGLTAQRLIREQQDDEYLASLQADREKAEARRLEEQAAKAVALEEERRIEEELRKKLEEEQEVERQLAAKEASLPKEPMSDDENAVTLLVRLPDGSRRGRRFLKTDKLQSLFNFIDVGRVVKPGTYRLVRPYPRRAFSDGESALTLNELGLTSKQEALFLELI